MRAQLRVGSLGFGGPLATMALMREELVEKRELVTRDSYFKALAAVKVMPGPVSSLLATYLGLEIAGVLGGLLSAFCFIFPSVLMMLAICIFEDHASVFFASPLFRRAMGGLQISIIAVIFYTCWHLFIEAYRRTYHGVAQKKAVIFFALLAAGLSLAKVHELAVLLICGLMAYAWLSPASPRAHAFSGKSFYIIFYFF